MIESAPADATLCFHTAQSSTLMCMKCGCVQPNLFVGPEPKDEGDFEQLRSMKVTAILSLQSEEDVQTNGLQNRRNTAARRGLIFHNVPVADFDRAHLRRRLRDCVAVLDDLLKSGQVVYLHCTAGVSRSPTVAAAFLHWKLRWTLDQAIAHLLTVRNCCPDAEVIRGAWNPCGEIHSPVVPRSNRVTRQRGDHKHGSTCVHISRDSQSVRCER